MGNKIRTTILLAVMTALIIWIGQLFGGQQGMIIALLIAAGMNFFSYWFSDKIVLKMYRAKEVSPQQAPEVYEMVQTLSENAGLPMPKLFVIPKEAPNAFATGRNPEGLARALEKLGQYSKRIPLNANPSTAHMFIVNPLSGKSLMSLFSTHPPLEERIVRLRGYPNQTGQVSKSGEDRRQAQGKAFWDRLSE